MSKPNTAVATESTSNTYLSEVGTTSDDRNDKKTSGDIEIKINDLWNYSACKWGIKHTGALKIEFKPEPEKSIDDFLTGHLYDVENDLNSLFTNDESKKDELSSWYKKEFGTKEFKEVENLIEEENEECEDEDEDEDEDEIVPRSNLKKNEAREKILTDKFVDFLRKFFNDVKTKIKRPFEIGTDLVFTEGDIECKNDGHFLLSVEAKSISTLKKLKSDPKCQLVPALLSQAFFKLRRGQVFNGIIEVYGIVLLDDKVNFFKANFKKTDLECIKNGTNETLGTTHIMYYPSTGKEYKEGEKGEKGEKGKKGKNDYGGLSLSSSNQLKQIIETLYRIKASSQKDYISEYFLDNGIKFHFSEKYEISNYSMLIDEVVKKPNKGILAGGYFLLNQDKKQKSVLDLYICAEQLHEDNAEFDETSLLEKLSDECINLINNGNKTWELDISNQKTELENALKNSGKVHKLINIISSFDFKLKSKPWQIKPVSGPSYFAELNNSIYLKFDSEKKKYKICEKDESEQDKDKSEQNKDESEQNKYEKIETKVRFTQHSSIRSLLCSFNFYPAQIGYCKEEKIFIMDWYKKGGPLYEESTKPTENIINSYEKKGITAEIFKEEKNEKLIKAEKIADWKKDERLKLENGKKMTNQSDSQKEESKNKRQKTGIE